MTCIQTDVVHPALLRCDATHERFHRFFGNDFHEIKTIQSFPSMKHGQTERFAEYYRI